MKPTYTTQNVLRMILDDLRGSHLFSDVFIIFSVLAGCSPKKKHLKVPELCRSDVGYLWLLFKSARTYWTTYLRWTRSFARKIWITYGRAHMTYHQNSSNQPDGPMVSTDPHLFFSIIYFSLSIWADAIKVVAFRHQLSLQQKWLKRNVR